MRRVLLVLLAVLASSATPAREWKWLSEFTEASSPVLAELHGRLHRPRLDGAGGYPVNDLHWRDAGLDLHMISGRIFLEESLDGVPMGAWFEGQAEVTVRLDDRNAQKSLQRWLSTASLEAEPVSFAYILAFHSESVAALLGLEGEREGEPARMDEYETVKSSLEQEGTDLLYDFLNHQGRSRDTAHVVFAPERIRSTGSQHALMRHSFRPRWRREIRLSVFGNKDLEQRIPQRFHYITLGAAEAPEPRNIKEADVTLYSTRLSLGAGKFSATEETTIHMKPTAGLYAMGLSFEPQMVVRRVVDGEGRSLPFLQWQYLSTQPNYDQSVLVAFPEMAPEGQEITITVASEGALFERVGTSSIHWLMEEDEWYPKVDDPGSSEFELFVSVPKKYTAVASGDLLSDEVVDGRREYHYRTPRPVYGSTIYFGELKLKAGKADDTKIEVYVDANAIEELQNQNFMINEVGNAVKFYNRRLAPLQRPVLRVTSTPTGHGRGFDGLILLSYHGFGGDFSDLDMFRAHEVAHQWWGNMVEPRRWPEDRWLSESFAEYMALEYYKTRYDKPEKLKDLIYQQWTQMYLDPMEWTARNASGDRVGVTANEVAVSEGSGNVYSKGPEILHMLRYMFLVQKGEDDPFWAMLSSFLTENAYQQVSTEDFMAHAEKHLGMDLAWFWEQWLYGTAIPEVQWEQSIQRSDAGYLLTVSARQDTDFTLLIPIYVHFGGGQQINRPLILEGGAGQRQLMLPQEPARVSLNDFHEALVRLKP